MLGQLSVAGLAATLLFVSGGFGPLRAQSPGSSPCDCDPASTLVTRISEVRRARYPVIDVHGHLGFVPPDLGGLEPQDLVGRMDELNVRTIVNLTGSSGFPGIDPKGKASRPMLVAGIEESLRRWDHRFPGRFMSFTRIQFGQYVMSDYAVSWASDRNQGDPVLIKSADFPAEAVRALDEDVRAGARGLKILKELGLVFRDWTGKLIPVDDPRLDPIWEECGKLGIPVAMHTGDPKAFFLPFDRHNELYGELLRHPEWRYAQNPELPSLETLLEQRRRVFARHPHTTFIALHFDEPFDLGRAARLLDQYPNVYVEFGEREMELGRQPFAARAFFLNYQERILFGTDEDHWKPAMYRNYFRWLESADDYFDYWGYPKRGAWKIYGLGLPDEVLKKIYYGNALRLFPSLSPWFKDFEKGVLSKN